jgi:single-stranded DNA-binding protein
VRKKGETAYTRFGLVSTDYSRQADGTTRERVTRIWMVAFKSVGEFIGRYGKVGDQLFVRGRIINTSYLQEGKRRHSYSFMCDDVKFGNPGRAKREAFARLGREGRSADGDVKTAEYAFAAHNADRRAVESTASPGETSWGV